jgi:hypothetical protein
MSWKTRSPTESVQVRRSIIEDAPIHLNIALCNKASLYRDGAIRLREFSDTGWYQNLVYWRFLCYLLCPDTSEAFAIQSHFITRSVNAKNGIPKPLIDSFSSLQQPRDTCSRLMVV